MDMAIKHRKTVKHFESSPDVHELTFSCHQRKPLLTNEDWKQLLGSQISIATSRHQYRLIAFVFMPEHVHLLVLPLLECSSISTLLSAIKRPFSHRLKQHLIDTDSPLLGELTERKRSNQTSFQFWQSGPGYDRNITENNTLQLAINYIHENPVNRGLCERATDWKWSSARWFVYPDQPQEEDLPTLDRLPLNPFTT